MWLVIMILSLTTAGGVRTPGSYVSGPYADDIACVAAAETQVKGIMGNPQVTQYSYHCWSTEEAAQRQAFVWAHYGPSPPAP